MSIDIDMTVGLGIHVTKEKMDKWLEVYDPDGDYGGWESLVDLLGNRSDLAFSWAGNAWIGQDSGYVIWYGPSAKTFDMGRSAQAGVYEPNAEPVPLEAWTLLDEVGLEITGEHLRIRSYVVVSVS